ncbi:hypothetical protein B0H14DRAFT_3146164 [Mycena olivaceomarginata]|nr:hypothetical protein B0H14DRAFT_3146164 [Mycena olivaceomarginata]
MLALFVLSLLAAFLPGINAVLKNVTVDDTDTHTITLSSDAAANATFEFVGTAVYYVSPRWPYMVTSRISIDGGAAVSVNLTDLNASPTPIGGSESAMYSVAWSATNLANKSHKILVTYENYIVVDGFLYTMDDGTAAPSSSFSPSSASASSTSSSPSRSPSASLAASSDGASTVTSTHKGLTIGLATALPLAALLAAALLAFAFCQRRRGNLHRRPTRTKFVLDDSPPAQPVYAAVAPVQRPQMSDVSSSVHSPYPSSMRSNVLAPDEGTYQAFSGSSHANLSSQPNISSLPSDTPSISSYPRSTEAATSFLPHGAIYLPPGAMSPPVALNPYNRDEYSSGPASGGAGATSDLRRGVSRPPAYSERNLKGI